MSRVDNIKKFAAKVEYEEKMKEIKKTEQIKELKNKIRELKPRIDELVEVGNACLDNGIPLVGIGFGCREEYNTHQFFSNSWSHLTGFVKENDELWVGKIGGGACDWNLKTNGIEIYTDGQEYNVLKWFLEEFDEFETEFYNYVDKVTSK